MKTVNIKNELAAYPIIATGERWPHRTEGEAEQRGSWGNFFGRFPFLEGDPRYADFGKCPDVPGNPPPGARGGGLWPTLHMLANGDLLCAAATGKTHKLTPGGECSLTVSRDRGKTWSPYRVIAKGGENEDAGPWPTLGLAADGALVHLRAVLDLTDLERPAELAVSRSTDGGCTWDEPKPFDVGQLGDDLPNLGLHGPIMNVGPKTMVINLRGGYPAERRTAMPDLPERRSYLLWSYDEGRTFTELTFIADKTETSFLPLDAQNWICYSRMPWVNPEIGRSADGGQSFDWTRQYVLSDSFWTYDSGYPCTVCYDDGTMVTVAYTIFDMDHPEWGTCAVAYVYHESVFD